MWWALAAALALVPVLRAASWVVVPCAVRAPPRWPRWPPPAGVRWGELFGGLGALWARLPRRLGARRPRGGARRRLRRRAGPAARGAALAAVLLAVFVPLLASADAAFAQLLEDAVPTGELDQPFGAGSCSALFVVSLGGALPYVAAAPAGDRARGPPRYALGRVEWALAARRARGPVRARSSRCS